MGDQNYFVFDCDPKYPVEPVLEQLKTQNIAFETTQEGDVIRLWVKDPKWVEPVAQFYRQYCHQQDYKFSISNLFKTPVTTFLLVFAILVALFTQLGQQFTSYFFIADIQYYPRGWNFFEGEWQFLWRSFSPIFLHFSIEHLIFNSLMVWYIGSLLERNIGSIWFGILVFGCAAVSNYSQLLDSGPLFGGLSGVAYGLVVFAFLYQKQQRQLFIPKGMFTLAFVWMVLGFTQVLSLIGLGNMANVAHLSGALAGGFIYGAFLFLPVFRSKK